MNRGTMPCELHHHQKKEATTTTTLNFDHDGVDGEETWAEDSDRCLRIKAVFEEQP
eukprot:m.90927 g.90927  ORF g.90927 m.90927 type:complete len:56 (+) comp51108_c0_seq1:985-1152(+)